MIIAVDFDGVLSSAGKWPEVGEPNEALMNWLSDLRTGGHKVILWTCRVGEALESAVAQCREGDPPENGDTSGDLCGSRPGVWPE